LSTDTPLADGLATQDATAPAGTTPEQLCADTEALARAVAAAFSTVATTELQAGPADAQDGPDDLLPPGGVHGVIAGLRETDAVQIVLLVGEELGRAAGTAEDDSPEPWMAPVTAAMESWATERGGVLVNAMPVGDADQLRHLLVTAEGTTLAASGLFAGTELVGSVAVTGRTVAAQDTTQDEAAADAPTAAPPQQAPQQQAPQQQVAAPNVPTAHAAPAAPAAQQTRSTAAPTVAAMHVLSEVEMKVTAELGRTRMCVSELLSLAPGSLIELDRTAGSPIDLLVNGTLIARGEVVVIDEEYGVRLTEITGHPES